MKGGSSDGMVPEPVLDSAKTTLRDLGALRGQFLEFLSLADPDVLAELPPLQRARALLVLAKAASTLLAVRLRCTGVDPDDHPIKSELERLSLYEGKLERLVDLSKAPLRPSTTLNHQAATRFIEHSLPDLTPDQRQSMRELSRGGGPTPKSYERKRKYQSSGFQSVQATTKDFLEKAAQELLGSNRGGFKGPLIDDSDDENEHEEVIKGLVEISSDED
ncbi:nuclear nucleic acid-binding protein C1D [Rhodamnia argentea]|uniref:Nuclear nucleic acid-binding protein C1D n=1 Tax=Rhodamnia argentea TaxID=178133 RepID=A0A8B8NLV0_9MYRT|nr:nuclear nucleic acid-binding protein C1D [Rhodamnia argentea]